MLKKPASGVLGSSKSSTYPRGYASGFDSPAALLDGLFEHPAWHYPVATEREAYVKCLVAHGKRLSLGIGRKPYALKGKRLGACLHPDRFDHLHVFGSESELFSLEIVFHMLRVRGAGQREHPDLHRKSKHDLCKTGP